MMAVYTAGPCCWKQLSCCLCWLKPQQIEKDELGVSYQGLKFSVAKIISENNSSPCTAFIICALGRGERIWWFQSRAVGSVGSGRE